MKSKKISVKFDQNMCDFGDPVFSLVVVAVELTVSPIQAGLQGRSIDSVEARLWKSQPALSFAQTKWQLTHFTVCSGAVPMSARDDKAVDWV